MDIQINKSVQTVDREREKIERGRAGEREREEERKREDPTL